MKSFIPAAAFCVAVAALTASGAETIVAAPAEAPHPVRLPEVRLRDCCVWPDTNTHTYYVVSATNRRGPNGRPAVITYTSKDLNLWEGPREQQEKRLFSEDGGHPMLFQRFDGQLIMMLHQPNKAPNERVRLLEIEDAGDTLRLKAR